MLIESFEKRLLSTVVNPALKAIISKFDIECEVDGSLLLNSLRQFLGDNLELCSNCQILSNRVANPFYEVGSRILRAEKEFMKDCFLNPDYGDAWLKGFALMMKGIERFGIRIPFVPAGPFEIVWNFTSKCNLKCKHCYADAGKKRAELSTDDAFMVVEKLSEVAQIGLPALSFSGGEPLLREDLFEVAAYANKKIPYLSIATNGTLLTKDNVRRLKDVGIDYVEISLDGATKEVHESFRGVKGCFERTMRGIRNSLDEGIETCIATTFQQHNKSQFKQLINLVDELGIMFMHFNYIPTGRAKDHIMLDLTPEDRFTILETLGRKIIDLFIEAKEERKKIGKAKTRVDRFFSTCPQYASVVKEIATEKKLEFGVSAHYAAMKGIEKIANFLGGCGAGRLYMCLEPNGDLKPCVFFPTNPETVRGNILRDDFEKVWNQDKMFWSLRSRETLKSYTIEDQPIGCGTCEDKYICGGCRARSYSYFNRDLDAPDIGCIHNKSLWEKTVPQLVAQLEKSKNLASHTRYLEKEGGAEENC